MHICTPTVTCIVHLIRTGCYNLYQESLKKKDKRAVETNFVSKNESVDHDLNDITHLDVADFFIQLGANIEHLFGDENLQK